MTPRAMSALHGGYLGNVLMGAHQPVTATASAALYLHERVRKSTRRGGAPARQAPSPRVQVFDMSRYLFVSRDLAEHYVIDSKDAAAMCRHNRRVAERFGYAHVAKSWSLAELIATSATELEADDDVFCSQIPFPKNCLEKM